MYQRIVVPLDGSKLAESVLPHIEALAKSCAPEELTLVSVTERISGQRITFRRRLMEPSLSPGRLTVQPDVVTTVPVVVGKKQRQAERYLNRIAKRLGDKGVKVQTRVLLGNPAEEIVNYAKENGCDLIVMASHGHTGLDKWAHSIGAFSSVTDKVLRASPVSVLVVKTV